MKDCQSDYSRKDSAAPPVEVAARLADLIGTAFDRDRPASLSVCPHSLSDSTGLTRAARQAGTIAATLPESSSATAANPMLSGSVAVTP